MILSAYMRIASSEWFHVSSIPFDKPGEQKNKGNFLIASIILFLAREIIEEIKKFDENKVLIVFKELPPVSITVI